MTNGKTSNYHNTNSIKNKTSKNFDLTSSTKQTIQAFGDVEFGMLSKKCRHFGICRIEKRNKLDLNVEYDNKKNKPGADALVSISPNGQIELAFFKSNLNEITAKLFFGNGKFMVGEDYIYTPTSESNLSSFKIKKGNYSIIETLGFLIVTFKNQ